MIAVTDLRCEYAANPLGIDSGQPRFSWYVRSDRRGGAQAGYQIVCADSLEAIRRGEANLWDTGMVSADRHHLIPYGGARLESFGRHYWRVRIRDDGGAVSPWSDTAMFETAMLSPDAWKGMWISMKDPVGTPSPVLLVGSTIAENSHVQAKLCWAIYLRRRFEIARVPNRARVHVSGLGYYDLLVNGKHIGDHRLDPGQTDYAKIALYATHDVTAALRPGANVIQIVLGNGRHLDAYGFGAPRAKLQLLLESSDGQRDWVATDEAWKCSHGAIEWNGIYAGERWDARKELAGWGEPDFDDSAWQQAVIIEGPPLVSQLMPPIRAVKVLAPRRMSNPRPGVFVYDFGQNFTGVVRLHARGPAGTTMQMRFSELIEADGMLNLGTNRESTSVDEFVLKGEGEEEFEPRFTYHGFRYLELTGFPGVPCLDSVLGIVMHTDVKQTGAFRCSNDLINRIHENILWGQRSNIMSAPTDCPQRGERMGWLGDAQLTSEEAACNFDMAGFYTKYLEDIRRAQREDGSVSDVVPPFWPLYPADPAWGTAYVTLAWTLYQRYGDREVLERHYDGLKRYVDFLHGASEGHIIRSLGRYGDWCPPGSVFPKKTPIELTSTWYYYHDTMHFSRIAEVLERARDAERYRRRAEEIRDAFNRAFLLGKGRYATLPMSPIDRSLGQTSQALPLYLDMVPPDQKADAVTALLDAVAKDADYHVDTGIVGTRYLFEVLRETGNAEAAYKVVTQKSYPGWGYMLEEGATTLWERWEKLGGLGMNSHNHIMFGSIDAWFYRSLAGIVPTAPGGTTVRIQPWPVGDVTHAAAEYRTIHGPLVVRWQRTEKVFRLTLDIPTGSTADVRIPMRGDTGRLLEGGSVVWGGERSGRPIPGISCFGPEARFLALQVQSGSYDFELKE